MNERRRRIVTGAVAGAAALAGAVWSWLRLLDSATPDDGGLWQMRFERPGGGVLSMAELRGRPLLLNFWATWCAPCIREMPELDRFHRDAGRHGWQVLGLAIDNPDAVREFLARRPVGFDIGLAGADGHDLLERLGNGQGLLPFTVAFDAQGRPRRHKFGATTLDELQRWAASS